MISRRTLLATTACLAVAVSVATPAWAAEPATTIDAFYAVLLSVMKDSTKLGFKGRRDKLAPAVRQAFDLPLMTRLTVGLQWANLSPAEQQQLVTAFSEFSIANYASQFDDYSGERFEVDPKADPAPGNDQVVHTKLLQPKDKPVQLDYLMRQVQGGWRVIDVFLSGTISQLAARRSEFSAILRQDGPQGLVAVLKQKTAALAGG
jgi:phospholipid transport system substrate-binding protein